MIRPRYSKREVDRAGKQLAFEKDESAWEQRNIDVVNYWRGIHMEPLQQMLEIAGNVMPEKDLLIAGRIKKFDTIIDKLRRPDTPLSLKSTYDIAGCRVVVPDLETQKEYCQKLESTTSVVDLEKTEKKDYLLRPHPSGSGYRSRHMICRFSGLSSGHELFVELQVRTIQQHAWATAVELFDKAVESRLKFNDLSDPRSVFFKKSSELIRQLEENKSVDPSSIRSIDNNPENGKIALSVKDALEAASCSSIVLSTNSIEDYEYLLIDLVAGEQTVIVTGVHGEDAMREYEDHEKMYVLFGDDMPEHDTVLVRGVSLDQLEQLYPNYFGNISVFTNLIAKHFVAFR